MSDLISTGFTRNGAANPNPFFDTLTGFVPRKLKDLFRWAEYLYTNSPTIFAAVQKLASYPVTRVTIETSSQVQKKLWTTILNEHIKIRGVANETGLDRRIYGNSFISVYRPFDRFLKCSHSQCGGLTGVSKIKYQFQLKTLKFKYHCEACERDTTGEIHDMPVRDYTRIRVIRWDPKLIDIDYNPITGTSKYYYTVPQDLKMKVEKGNEHIINTMPLEFLRAIQKDKLFAFAPGQIYHMKMPAPAGIDAQWGLPPLLCNIKAFYYAAVLRKANEAIALDHTVPLRVLHPAAGAGNATPSEQLNLGNWQAQMTENVKAWRRDPNHIMMSPVALGVSMMGGQGRSLMVLGEIKDAEESIIAGMGVPREFIYGGMTLAGSGISLRMLENQLESDAEQHNEQLEWIIGQIAACAKLAPVEATFVPFKLVDDTEQKAALMQLQQILGNPLSKAKMLEGYDVDLEKEQERSVQEQLSEMRAQMKLQQQQQKLQNSASAQADAAASQGAGMSYNPQAVLAAADQLVQQLGGLDEGTRQSQMDQLSQEDPVMYAVVRDRMDSQASMLRQQAVAQQRQEGAAV